MAKNSKIKPQETQGFNVENPSNVKGKNHGRQLANLHYIGCVFTTPNGGLQEELTKRGANPTGYINRTPQAPLAQAFHNGPPLRSVGSRPFLVQ